MPGGAIAAGAGRQRAHKVDLGEELDVIPRPDRARFHEILPGIAGEAGAHEHVEHVVNVPFGLPERQAQVIGQRAGEVGVAAMVVGAAGEQAMGVGIAAGADHVMHRAAIGVDAIPVERVAGDRCQRAQVGQARPQPVAGGNMGAVQRPGLARKEALRDVMGVPEIEIAHLWPLHRADPEKTPRWHLEGACLARRHQQIGHLLRHSACLADLVEAGRGQGFRAVDQYRRHGPPCIGIAGGRVVWAVGFHRHSLVVAGGVLRRPPPGSSAFAIAPGRGLW